MKLPWAVGKDEALPETWKEFRTPSSGTLDSETARAPLAFSVKVRFGGFTPSGGLHLRGVTVPKVPHTLVDSAGPKRAKQPWQLRLEVRDCGAYWTRYKAGAPPNRAG